MTGLHQFVPNLEPGAVGAHVLQLQRIAQGMGLDSEVFAEHVHPAMAGRGRVLREYGRSVPARADDVLVYQSAIGSPVADFVLERPQRLAVNYHNITPPQFFAVWEPDFVYALSWGRAQLRTMADRSSMAIADSSFNQAELVALGYRRTEVVPVLVDLSSFAVDADAETAARLRVEAGGGAGWLFVGRVAPNKAQHDLVKAFAAYRRVYDGKARLRIVGAPASDAYGEALRRFAAATGLEGAVELVGAVTHEELAAHYRAADVFVCLSDHEGFCIPLLEAMHHRLPIVAYAAAAVPETLGSGGLCLPAKAPTTVAAAVYRVVSDVRVREGLAAAGAVRLADFDLTRTGERMAAVLRDLVAV